MANGTQSSSAASPAGPPPGAPPAAAAASSGAVTDPKLLQRLESGEGLIDQYGEKLTEVTDPGILAKLNAQGGQAANDEAAPDDAPQVPQTPPGLLPAGQAPEDPDQQASSFSAPLELAAQAGSGLMNYVGVGLRNTAKEIGGATGLTKKPTHEELTKPFVEPYEPSSPLAKETSNLVHQGAGGLFDLFEKFVNGALDPDTWRRHPLTPQQEADQAAQINAGQKPENYFPPNLNHPTDPGIYAGGLLQLFAAGKAARGGAQKLFKSAEEKPPGGPPPPPGAGPGAPPDDSPPGGGAAPGTGPAPAGGGPAPGGAQPAAGGPAPNHQASDVPPPPPDQGPNPGDVYNTREATAKLPGRREALGMSPQERMDVASRMGQEHMRHSAVHMDIRNGAVDYEVARNHGPAREAFEHERNVLTTNAERLIRNTGGTQGLTQNARSLRGRTIATAVDSIQEYFDRLRNGMYDKVKAHTGDKPYILPQRLQTLLADPKFNNTLMGDELLPFRDAAVRELQRHLERNGGRLSVSQAEDFRQWLNARYTRKNAAAIRDMKKELDDDVIGYMGTDYFARSRQVSEMEHALLHNPDFMEDLFGKDTRTATNRGTAYEDLPDRIMTLPADQFNHLMTLLEHAPRQLRPQVSAAIREIQAHFANHIRDAGEGSPRTPWNAFRVEDFLNSNDQNLERAFARRPDLIDHIRDIAHLGHINWTPTAYEGAAVQARRLLDFEGDPAPPRVDLKPSVAERVTRFAGHGTGVVGRTVAGGAADWMKGKREAREARLNEEQTRQFKADQAKKKEEAQRAQWEARRRPVPTGGGAPRREPILPLHPGHPVSDPYGLPPQGELPPLPPDPPPPGETPPPPPRPNTRSEQHLEDIRNLLQSMRGGLGGGNAGPDVPPEALPGAPPPAGGMPPGGAPPSAGPGPGAPPEAPPGAPTPAAAAGLSPEESAMLEGALGGGPAPAAPQPQVSELPPAAPEAQAPATAPAPGSIAFTEQDAAHMLGFDSVAEARELDRMTQDPESPAAEGRPAEDPWTYPTEPATHPTEMEEGDVRRELEASQLEYSRRSETMGQAEKDYRAKRENDLAANLSSRQAGKPTQEPAAQKPVEAATTAPTDAPAGLDRKRLLYHMWRRFKNAYTNPAEAKKNPYIRAAFRDKLKSGSVDKDTEIKDFGKFEAHFNKWMSENDWRTMVDDEARHAMRSRRTGLGAPAEAALQGPVAPPAEVASSPPTEDPLPEEPPAEEAPPEAATGESERDRALRGLNAAARDAARNRRRRSKPAAAPAPEATPEARELARMTEEPPPAAEETAPAEGPPEPPTVHPPVDLSHLARQVDLPTSTGTGQRVNPYSRLELLRREVENARKVTANASPAVAPSARALLEKLEAKLEAMEREPPKEVVPMPTPQARELRRMTMEHTEPPRHSGLKPTKRKKRRQEDDNDDEAPD